MHKLSVASWDTSNQVRTVSIQKRIYECTIGVDHAVLLPFVGSGGGSLVRDYSFLQITQSCY